jgi:hypothetical protein
MIKVSRTSVYAKQQDEFGINRGVETKPPAGGVNSPRDEIYFYYLCYGQKSGR